MAEVIATLFEMWGAEVTIAQSVGEVRQLLAGRSFDLITVEIAMPGESGADLWRYLCAEHPRLAGGSLFLLARLATIACLPAVLGAPRQGRSAAHGTA